MSCEFKVGDIVVLKENQPDTAYYAPKKNIKFKIIKVSRGYGDFLINGISLDDVVSIGAYTFRFELAKSKTTKPIKWV